MLHSAKIYIFRTTLHSTVLEFMKKYYHFGDISLMKFCYPNSRLQHSKTLENVRFQKTKCVRIDLTRICLVFENLILFIIKTSFLLVNHIIIIINLYNSTLTGRKTSIIPLIGNSSEIRTHGHNLKKCNLNFTQS